VTIGLTSVSDEVDLHGFADKLAAQLSCPARVRVIDSAALDEALGQRGAANGSGSDAGRNRHIALLLDTIESENDFVLLLSDRTPTPWTHRCT
jgi:NTE family protein